MSQSKTSFCLFTANSVVLAITTAAEISSAFRETS